MKCLEIFTRGGEISNRFRGKNNFFLLSFPRLTVKIFCVNVDLLLRVFIFLKFRLKILFFFQLQFFAWEAPSFQEEAAETGFLLGAFSGLPRVT